MNKMKKLAIAIGCFLLLLVCSLYCSTNKAYAKEQTEFIVGFDAEFPPYGYLDESGDYIGFDLSLAEEVCKRNDWKLIKRPISWDSKDSELTSGAISCIWNGFTMNGREKSYTWSTPYLNNYQVVIVRKDSSIKKPADLKGKVLVVQSDSSALAALTGDDATQANRQIADSLKELQQVGDYNSAFMNLESGMVDAIAMDYGVAVYQMSAKSDEFRILDDSLSAEQYAIGFKKGNTTLRNKVQTTLLEMLYDGTLENIAKEWGLSKSLCLSFDDKTYIDGGAVPTIDTSKLTKVTPAPDKQSQTKGSKNKVKKLSAAQIAKQLRKGMISTLLIFFLTILFSIPLGLLVCLIRMSHWKLLQYIAKIYISIMRGTPLMLQLLVVFFAPYYAFHIHTPYSYRFLAVIIGFSLNYAAYFAEIYRAGFQGIPIGQREAATVMGYNRLQTFGYILFPQMVKRVLPPVTNEIITLVKDTSLAFALAYTEMFTLAKQIAASQTSLLPLFIAGVFYYVFNFVVAYVMETLENKLNYYH